MRSYKEYEKVYLGGSDVAAITVTGCGEDGLKAEIYLVDENAEIGSHYKLDATFNTWINVYDDDERTYHIYPSPGAEIKIYRAGDFGCIIQIPELPNRRKNNEKNN